MSLRCRPIQCFQRFRFRRGRILPVKPQRLPQEIVALGPERRAEANLHFERFMEPVRAEPPEFYKYKSPDSLEFEAALLNRLATMANQKLPLNA